MQILHTFTKQIIYRKYFILETVLMFAINKHLNFKFHETQVEYF